MTLAAGAGDIGVPSMVWGALSHVGTVRTNNEDSYHVSAGTCLVSDGMGGHAAGDVASRIVVDSFERWTLAALPTLADLETRLESINQTIRQTGVSSGAAQMGTTVVGVTIVANGEAASAVAFNIGDSRCYRLSGGELRQVTVDHSHVQELIDAGEISQHDARVHPMRNVVTRALGIDPRVRADYHILADAGCRLLLCSDGLSSEVGEHEIRELLVSELDPQRAAAALVERALGRSAQDNVTVIVVDLSFEIPGDDDETLRHSRVPTRSPEITAPRLLRPLVPPAPPVFPPPTPIEETP